MPKPKAKTFWVYRTKYFGEYYLGDIKGDFDLNFRSVIGKKLFGNMKMESEKWFKIEEVKREHER